MTSSALRVGLTGGVGAGKSTVAAAFAERGVPVFSADAVAHALTAPGMPLLTDIRHELGDGVFDETGALDRQAVAARVFSDDGARRHLEALLHPPIREALRQAAAGVEAPYCIIEVPLLREQDKGPLVDRVLLVELSPEGQLQRLAETRGLARADAAAIVAAQPAPADRQALADDVFANDGAPSGIAGAVDALHEHYLAIARDRHPDRAGLRLPAR